jgi:hypothetical protein
MKVELVGGMLYVDLTNINGGAGTASYSKDVSSHLPSLGTGVGMAAYKQAQLDNFSVSIGITEIDIVIKPCGDPNRINLRSKGVVRVAILTTDSFDATTVDPSTVMFAGAPALQKPAPKMTDVCKRDGDADLVLYFATEELNLDNNSTEATLTGETYGGTPVEGTASVLIVTKGPHN